MKTKTTVEIVYEADPKEYAIRNHLINRLENPNCGYGKYRYRLFRALGIVDCREVQVKISFEDVP